MEDQLCNDNMALREALIECLSHILSPEQQLRSNAEERLKLLEVTEGSRLFRSVFEYEKLILLCCTFLLCLINRN